MSCLRPGCGIGEFPRPFSLTNALRFDHLTLGRSGTVPADYPFVNADWNKAIQVISFNSGLVWRTDDWGTLRVIANRGVQLPSLANLGALLIDTPYIHLTGVPGLKPTVVSKLRTGLGFAILFRFRRGCAPVSFYQVPKTSHRGPVVSSHTGGVYLTSRQFGDSSAEGV